uniref:Uncharacterized protein n=1 Tax=Araucaria cunninghamii TaxID=56994 RepID=A0A0D6QTB6_ARACU
MCTRFEEVAKLDREQYIQIWGKFDCKLLSPNTDYVLSFLINDDDCRRWWNRGALKFFVTPPEGEKMEPFRVPADLQRADQDPKLGSASLKCEHEGWMEIFAGEFTTKSYSNSSEPKILRFGMEQLSHISNCRFLFGGVKIQPKSS